jgi:hypothetical protein
LSKRCARIPVKGEVICWTTKIGTGKFLSIFERIVSRAFGPPVEAAIRTISGQKSFLPGVFFISTGIPETSP